MSFLRKLGLFFSGFVFRSALFIGLTLLAAVSVFGNSGTFKEALLQADAYNRYSQSIIDAGKNQGQNDPNTIPLDDPKIAEIIKESLNSKSLQIISENAIDAAYRWLEGDTNTIEFSADLSQNKEILASGVSNYAIERLGSLPVCSEVPEQTNIFRISCYPFNTNISSLRSQIHDALIQDTSIFKSSTITEEDFPKSSDGRLLTDVYSEAPNYYKWFKLAPWIFLAIALIGFIAVMHLSRTKRKGLHGMAASIIVTGVILAVAPIIYTYVLPSAGLSIPGAGSSQNGSITAITNDMTKHIYGEFNTALINIAIQVIIAGFVLLLSARYLFVSKSPYQDLKKRTGLSVSIDEKPRPSGLKISSEDIPVQTSERPGKTKRKVSNLEKKFRRL